MAYICMFSPSIPKQIKLFVNGQKNGLYLLHEQDIYIRCRAAGKTKLNYRHV